MQRSNELYIFMWCIGVFQGIFARVTHVFNFDKRISYDPYEAARK